MDSELVLRRDEVFASFVRRRNVLNESLDESRRVIDTWLDRQPMPPPISALANLEVLLKARRDLLAELVALDDEFSRILRPPKEKYGQSEDFVGATDQEIRE